VEILLHNWACLVLGIRSEYGVPGLEPAELGPDEAEEPEGAEVEPDGPDPD
jgi:hypothetical protein